MQSIRSFTRRIQWAILASSMPAIALAGLAQPVMAGETRAPTLLRAALLVSDASRSIEFYRLLGFQVDMDQTTARQAQGNPFPLNVPATQTRLVILASATGAGGRIGLVEFNHPRPTDTRTDRERVGLGSVVLVFDVADADAIHTQLLAAKARILEPPQIYVSKRTAADGRALRGKVFHVLDPDGYLVELLEAAQ
jgi:catechol 2,3-dioxygenase-like lactoylglutathione lyase family enzyme